MRNEASASPKKGEGFKFTREILAPEIAGTESRLSGSAQVEFLFLVVGVDGHGCYGRATRVIGETDFARKFTTFAVFPPWTGLTEQ